MKRTTLLSATLVVFALPLSAQTGAGWSPGQNFIDSWDYDRDGKVTLDEVLERRGDLFASFDDNDDGQLTAAEFANHDQMRDAMWEARDFGRGEAGVTQGGGRGQAQAQAQGYGQQRGQGKGYGQPRGQGQGYGQQQGQGRSGMSMGGQPGWGGQQMGRQGNGYGMPPAMGMLRPEGPNWGPNWGQNWGPNWGPGYGYGYGPQAMVPGWGYGPQATRPGYGYGPGPQDFSSYGYGPQAMGPGYGYGPQAIRPDSGQMGPQGMQGGFGRGNGTQGMPRGMQGGQAATGPQIGGGYGAGDEFTMLDADGDGTVSTEEFVAMGEDWFARFDPDGDGAVTAEDFGPGRR